MGTHTTLSLLAAVAALGSPFAASAATYMWDGGHNAQDGWTFQQNWNPNGVPENDGTADLIFSGIEATSPDSGTTAWSVNSITFDSTAAAFTLIGTGPITLQGNAVSFALVNDDLDTQTINVPLATARAQTWSARAGALVINGTVANDYALTLGGAFTTTLNGVVSGAGSLTKTGSGTTVLLGANTYSGGTTVSAGTLQGTTTSLQGDILNNALLAFDQTTAGTYAGIISGTGSLAKSGAGTVTLSGANTFSGATTISAGTLRVTSGSALSDTGAVTLANTAEATLDLAGSAETIGSLAGGGATGGNITLGTGGALTVGGAGTSTTYAGAISGAGSLTKAGAGTLTLSGANTYTGGTTVSAGTLRGTTTSLQGDIANQAALVFDQASAGTYTGVISGTGTLAKSGVGTVTFSGANTYTGGTTIAGGILRVSGGAALADLGAVVLADTAGATLDLAGSTETIGSLAGGGAIGGNVTLGTGGALTVGGAGASTTYAGAISGAGSLAKTGAGTLTLAGTNTYSGGTTVSAGTLRGSAASLQGDIANQAALVFDQASAGTYTGVISSAGSVTKTGAGTLTFTGANTLTGLTTVSGGTLALGANNALSAAAGLALETGVTLALGGVYSTRVSNLSYNGAALDFGAPGSANAFLFDAAGTGAGTLTVSNWETGSDVLAFASGNTPGASFIENIYFAGIGSGTLGTTGVSVSGYAGTWDTIVANPATFTVWNGGSADNNAFATGANWDGGLAPGPGLTTKVAFDGALRTAPVLTADFTLNGLKFEAGASAFSLTADAGRAFTFAGVVPSLIQASAADQAIHVPLTLTKNTFVELSGAGDLTLSGVVSGADGGFTVLGSGAGELVLAGANTYGGQTLINAGTVVLRDSAALGATSAGTRVAAGATLRLDNNISVGAEALVLDGTLRQASGTNSYGGAISGGGQLRVAGGQLTLSGASANTYAGGTVIDAGTVVLGKSAGVTALPGAVTVGDGSGSATLRLAAAHQIADGSRVTLAASGSPVFDLAGHAETIGSLASANSSASVALGSATLTTGADNSSTTFAGAISGAGGLTKQGSGAFTLSGVNTHAGVTTVSAGTLVVAHSAALGTTAGGTSVSNGAILELAGGVTVGDEALSLASGALLRQAAGANSYGGAISGGGQLRVAGGQLTVSGTSANTYTGGTVIDAGTVVLGKSAGVTALPGSVTVGDGSGSATLRLAAANQIADGSRVTLAASGSPVFDLAGHAETIGSLASANAAASVTLGSATLATGADNSSTTFAGVISGAGGLTKQGSGTLTLSGANTYAGATTVAAGTLALGASNRLADTSALALAGGTLALGGNASERVGALSFTDGGVLDFGAVGTANHLLFASAGSATGTLTVRNFSENIDVFGSATATVSAAFLDNIFFDGLGVGIGAQIDATTTNVAGYGAFYAIRPIETFVWTGGANGGGATDWGKNANWANEPSAPAINADRAVVFSGTTYLANNMDGAYVVRSLLFSSNAGAFALSAPGGESLTVNGGGIFNASASTQTLNMGIVAGANQTWTASAGDLVFAGATISLGERTLTLTGGHDITVSGVISGTGTAALVKNGDGTLTLEGANTYAGTTMVNAGTLAITDASALGASTAGTTVSTGAILDLEGGITVTGEALTLAGTLRGATGSNTYAGPITLSGAGIFESVEAGETFTLSGPINLSTHQATFTGEGDTAVTGVVSNSAGSVVKNGTGTLTFAAANTYTGATMVNAGTLVVSHGSALGTTAGGTTVASGATLTFTGGIAIGAEALTVSGTGADEVGALRNLDGENSFAGDVTFAGDTTLTSVAGELSLTGALAAGGHTLTVNGAGDLTFASTVSDAVDLVKTGAGTLTFSADQDFSGEVTLGGGTLAFTDADVSIATLRVTADSILDFGGTSVLTVGQLILDLADGQFLSITSWQDYTDFFYATEFDGAEFDLLDAAPVNRILFADFSSGDTRWKSNNNEITPVPEPAAYGLLSLAGLLAAPALRRRRRLLAPAA